MVLFAQAKTMWRRMKQLGTSITRPPSAGRMASSAQTL